MLTKKVDFAKHLIDVAANKCAKEGKRLEVAYSGGKDSDVLLWLAREVCGDSDILRPCYKNTTIDPLGTIQQVKSNAVEILKPRMSFGEIMQKAGFPSRFRRFCCSILKEYKVEDNVLIGVRKCESVRRSKRYREPEECRVFSAKERVHQYYPLLEFSDADIRDFVTKKGIQCHPLYYDANGSFHVERRLGCMCCPLQSEKERIAAFRDNPRMVLFYLRNGEKFLKDKPNSKMAIKNDFDVFKMFYNNLHNDRDASLFHVDYKDLIEKYFNLC